MRCANCQFENEEGARFCVECGNKLSSVCPSCKAPTKPEQKFCGTCGHQLRAPTKVQDETDSLLSPDRYTPQHLAQRILNSRSALEGERKQVTVLFADIRGSTELIATLDPEQTVRKLEPGLTAMLDSVHRFEGTVNQMMGDGIMALFGAPIAHEDHAARACFAAHEIQKSIKKNPESGLNIRVGLHSGEVMVRSIGNDLSMDYNAVGPTVHLAARMEQMAEAGKVLMTAATYRLAEDFIEAKSLGHQTVRGLPEPTEVFELRGIAETMTRWESRASRGLTKFVGREAEMSAVSRALQRAATARGPIVAIVGEAGMGKSRVVHEFLASPEVEGWRILQTAGDPHGRKTVHLPISNLLRDCLGVEARDSHATILAKARDGLADLDETLLDYLPAVSALLDLPMEDNEWQELYPPERRRRTIEAMKNILLRFAEIEPLILVFEDLHWIDTETEAILDSLVNSLGTSRLLLLATHRPGYQDKWGSKSYYTRIRIGPIEANTADAMLEDLLGNDPSLSRLKTLLVNRAEGTPFFLEEIVRTLIETGDLEGKRGRYRLNRDIEEIAEIPPTVQAVLAARIDRLPPEHKDLLQIASVIRQNVPVSLLDAVTGLPSDILQERLSELQAFEFLHESRRVPDLEYTFKHALTLEVAYNSVSMDRRRNLHTQVLSTIELLYEERLDEQAEQLAHHAVSGENWDKAVTYYRMAGNKAFDRSAYQEAIGFFDEALSALAHLPEEPETIEQAIDLRLNLRMALGPSEEFDRIIRYLDEAEEFAAKLHDKHRIAAINISRANVLNIQGNYDAAIESGRHAQEIAATLNNRPLSVGASFALGQAFTYSGDFREAVETFREHLEELRGELRHEQFGTTGSSAVDCLSNIALAHAQLGEFAEAIKCGRDACRIASETERPFDLAIAFIEYGSVLLWKGDIEEAIPLLEEALGICRRADIRQLYPNLAAQLGFGYALSNRLSEALPLLELALSQAESMHLNFFGTWTRLYLAQAHHLNGDPIRGLELANATLETVQDRKYKALEVFALRLMGTLTSLASPQHRDQAEVFLRKSAVLAAELGIQPEQAHCHRNLGEFYVLNGQNELAVQEATAASSLYKDLGMMFWHRKAGQLLAAPEDMKLPQS